MKKQWSQQDHRSDMGQQSEPGQCYLLELLEEREQQERLEQFM
jgi:hypothetical protein